LCRITTSARPWNKVSLVIGAISPKAAAGVVSGGLRFGSMWGRIVLRIVPIYKAAVYICICNAVTDREIRGAASLGIHTLDALREELGVASCCGKCEPEARRLLASCAGCPNRATALAGD